MFRIVRMTSFSLCPDLLDVLSFVLVGFLVSPDDTHFRSTYTVQLRAANAVMKYV